MGSCQLKNKKFQEIKTHFWIWTLLSINCMGRLVRLERDDVIMEKADEILVSYPHYEAVPVPDVKKVFEGIVVPLPLSLMLYLNYGEIKVFAIILNEIRSTGHCFLNNEDISKLIDITPQSAAQVVERLKRMGLVYVRKKDKRIDFNVVQYVEKLADKYGIDKISRIRKEIKEISPIDAPERIKITLAKKAKMEEELANLDPIELEEYN